MQKSVALIGSFRKHLPEMREAIEVFTARDLLVVNPLSSEPLTPDVEFVRFAEDDPNLEDWEIEQEALGRILGSTATYVICPEGYTGRTTSYEIGRAMAVNRPVYFSELPSEEYMRFKAKDRVVSSEELADLIVNERISFIL